MLLRPEELIYEKLADCVGKVSGPSTSPDWTLHVKMALADLGTKLGYEVYTSGVVGCRGQWLFDLAWARQREKPFHLLGLPLACQMQWSTDHGTILWDFCKLTVAIAELRLMLVTHASAESTEAIFDLCESACPPSKGLRYMTVGIPRGGTEQRDLPVRAWTT